MTISLTVFTFNCFTLSRNLFQKGFCTTVHVILIIAFLFFAPNYNVFHLPTLCLFLMPPSTQQHSRKLIFFVYYFFATRSQNRQRWQPCHFQSFVINDHQKSFWSYSLSAEDSILNISFLSILCIFEVFNRVSDARWENRKFT